MLSVIGSGEATGIESEAFDQHRDDVGDLLPLSLTRFCHPSRRVLGGALAFAHDAA